VAHMAGRGGGNAARAGAWARRDGGMLASSQSVVGPGRPSRKRATMHCVVPPLRCGHNHNLLELFSYLFSLF
jgi:hypothetical protein